jgi:hypothetical protein
VRIRDRDQHGRPRNARPRDELGRPLPRDSASGVEQVPERLSLSLEDAVELAQRYLDSGRPFHAHEVLEALWKSRPEQERDLWQGLAQLAVGLTHAMRGNPTGAIALLQRGDDRLRRSVGDRHSIAVDAITAAAQATIDRLSADGSGIDPAAFRLR